MIKRQATRSYTSKFDSSLTVSGLVLTFSGSGLLEGESVSIPETTYTVPPSNPAMNVFGHLVHDSATGKISLMVDEVAGADLPFPFGRHPTLTSLFTAFLLHVPANTKSLDDVEVTHFFLMQIEKPKPPKTTVAKAQESKAN